MRQPCTIHRLVVLLGDDLEGVGGDLGVNIALLIVLTDVLGEDLLDGLAVELDLKDDEGDDELLGAEGEGLDLRLAPLNAVDGLGDDLSAELLEIDTGVGVDLNNVDGLELSLLSSVGGHGERL